MILCLVIIGGPVKSGRRAELVWPAGRRYATQCTPLFEIIMVVEVGYVVRRRVGDETNYMQKNRRYDTSRAAALMAFTES